ncbi:MAG: glycoside hydrolase family 15 protein, partial [Solirubrobacteraceae bacterium]
MSPRVRPLVPGGRRPRRRGLGELFDPDLSTPSARALRFFVTDHSGHRGSYAEDVAAVTTTLVDTRSLSYRQTFAERSGRWRLTATYVTDPARHTVLTDVSFTPSKPGNRFDVYAVYEPTPANSRTANSGATQGDALTATHVPSSSALVGRPAFTATSSGYRGTSDGPTDLRGDGRMDWHYSSAAPGNLVQTAQLAIGRGGHATVALGFGGSPSSALSAARGSLATAFGPVASAYAAGWHAYVASLKAAPPSLTAADQRTLYRASAMTLAASEDKIHRGAYVASHTMPWIWGKEAPSGPYHLVWSRDLYQIATALIAYGDTTGGDGALDFLFDEQQKSDGSFPQNSTTDGTPFWGGLQLDEVALPIVLAHQLGRSDAGTWSHVESAANFLIGFQQDEHTAPWSPQDRWENQSGYSPATIASEIA